MEGSVSPETSSNPDQNFREFREQRAPGRDWQDLVKTTQNKLGEVLRRDVSSGTAEAYLALSNIAVIIARSEMMTARLRDTTTTGDLERQVDMFINRFEPREEQVDSVRYISGIDTERARKLAQPIKDYLDTLSERDEINQGDFNVAKEVVSKALLFPPSRFSSKPEDQKWRSIRNDLMRSTNYPSPLT